MSDNESIRFKKTLTDAAINLSYITLSGDEAASGRYDSNYLKHVNPGDLRRNGVSVVSADDYFRREEQFLLEARL